MNASILFFRQLTTVPYFGAQLIDQMLDICQEKKKQGQ